MSIFLFQEEEEGNGKISIDSLYEKKQKRDLKQISIFNKIYLTYKKFITGIFEILSNLVNSLLHFM